MTQKESDHSIKIDQSATGSTIVSGDGNTVVVNSTDSRQSARVSGLSGIPLQMPPLPDHFVERPKQQNAVKDELLDETTKAGTLVVSAIYGLGGIGKSVLASKLAHDREVQARFSDGILWATLGQNPDILPLLSGWIQALGDYDYKPTAVESASNHLRTLLYDKRTLLVVDDVWNPEHLGPFRVGGAGSCVMVTTREARIPEARRYDLDVMDAEQAIELMTQKLSEPLSEEAREQALAFAGRVGYLPLALELAASQVEEGVSWQELWEDFTAEVVRLEGLDTYGSEEMPDDAKRRKYSLLACFNLSLKQLSAQQLRQFAWLGIVPEDVSLTQEMAQTLWQVNSRQAGRILRTFRNKALVLQGAKQADGRVSYRMHDLMHDLAQRLLVSPVEPEKDGELPGAGLSKVAAHEELLSRYREKTQNGRWHTLKDDGYIFAHLTWHMEQAGQAAVIHELLCASNENGRNGWYETCDVLGKPAGFVNDLGRAWKLAVKDYEDNHSKATSKLFLYALIRSSLNSLSSNVPAELICAFVKRNIWQPAQGLAYAQQAQHPWQRAQCTCALVPYITLSLVPETIKIANQFTNVAYRLNILSKLSERFPENWTATLDGIEKIQSGCSKRLEDLDTFESKTLALCEVADKLPMEHVHKAIDITKQIHNDLDRAKVLIALSKGRPELHQMTLQVIHQIQDENSFEIAVCLFSRDLPEVLPEALEILHRAVQEPICFEIIAIMIDHRDIPSLVWSKLLGLIQTIEKGIEKGENPEEEEELLWTILKKYSEYVPFNMLPEMLEIVQQLKSDDVRSMLLGKLSRYFPLKLVHKGLEVTRQLPKDKQLLALSGFVAHSPRLIPELLDVARKANDPYDWAIAVEIISEYTPLELWFEVLHITRRVAEEEELSSSMCAIAKHLPQNSRDLWNELLEMAWAMEERDLPNFFGGSAGFIPADMWPYVLKGLQGIEDQDIQYETLSEISQYIPQEFLHEALNITRQIKDQHFQAMALITLVDHIPELRLETLEVVQQIPSDFEKSSVLLTLVPKLTNAMMREVLSVVQAIDSEFAQNEILITLIDYLPNNLMHEVLDIARCMENGYCQLSTLCKLAQYIPTILEKVLEATKRVENRVCRIRFIHVLKTHLRSDLLIEAVRQIDEDFSEPFDLHMLGEYLPTELIPEALEEVKRGSNFLFDSPMSLLVKRLSFELLPAALDSVSLIKDELHRSIELEVLIDYLPSEHLCRALEIANQIEDERRKSQAVCKISKRLPTESLTEILEMVQGFKDKSNKAKGLITLSKPLPALWPEAIQAVQIMSSEHDQHCALGNIDESVPDHMWPKVLDIIRQMQAEYICRNTICSISSYIPDDLWFDCLQIIKTTQDESIRVEMLCSVAKHVPTDSKQFILDIIKGIKDEDFRSKALREIAPYLPKSLYLEAIAILHSIQDKYYSAKALQGCLPHFEALTSTFSDFAKALDTLAYQNRSDLLELLPTLRPIAMRLGKGEETFLDVLQSVREVCRQWP